MVGSAVGPEDDETRAHARTPHHLPTRIRVQTNVDATEVLYALFVNKIKKDFGLR
jgi:hypothetical protein